jgi:hypothetical protein
VGKPTSRKKAAAKRKSTMTRKTAAASDPARETKQAVKAIMQFGDDPRAASAFTGDAEHNADLIADIVEQCRSSNCETLQINVIFLVGFEWVLNVIQGVDIDASSLRARVEDMAMLKRQIEAVESSYDRFRVTAQIASVRWKCNWGVRQDSMLMLGVHLYGVGAWTDILNDERLGLGAIVHKPNTDERIVANTHLGQSNFLCAKNRFDNVEFSVPASSVVSSDAKSSSETAANASALQEKGSGKRGGIGHDFRAWFEDGRGGIRTGTTQRSKGLLPWIPFLFFSVFFYLFSEGFLIVRLQVSSWCMAAMKENKTVVKTLKKLKIMDRGEGLLSDPKTVIKYIFRIGDYITRTGMMKIQ